MLHDGSDIAGPLRIHLRSAIPRFILRYRLLQEQISRLDLAAGATEGSPEEGLHLFHQSEVSLIYYVGYGLAEQHDGGQEPDHHDKEAQHEVSLAPHGQKDADETENTRQPEIYPGQPQDEVAATDTTSIPEIVEDATYHHVSGEASHTLEKEGDYESTNASTGYQEEGEGVLDAAAVHETADTDAATTINENSQFGGEETEYLDYVQPEEYDERYGEDFSEELAYDQTVGYGEGGEQDASTAVDESQAVLPGSDPYEAETTPVASAQLVDSTHPQRSEITDSDPHGEQSHLPIIIVSHPLLEQVDRLPSYEPSETISHHTDKGPSKYFAALNRILMEMPISSSCRPAARSA